MRNDPSNFDKVPVFTGRVSVTLDVADQLRVYLCSGIEAKTGLDLIVLQVAVDGLRAADNLDTIVLGSIVLSEHASICIGVVTTDDDHSLDVELAQNLKTLLKLVYLLQLGTAGTDHVEATGVAIIINKLRSQLHILMIDKATRAHQEAVDLVLWVHLLHSVEDTADDIVTARSS